MRLIRLFTAATVLAGLATAPAFAQTKAIVGYTAAILSLIHI